MSGEWETKIISEVCDIFDSLHKTPKYTTAGYPMVRVSDLEEGFLDLTGTFKVPENVYNEFTRKYKPTIGDIIFSRVGTYGVSAYVNTSEPFCLGQNTVVLKPKINSLYFYYCMISPKVKRQIQSLVSGSTQKTISLQSIKSIDVFLPPLAEQTRIANLFSSLDNKIDLLQRQNTTLEKMAQTLFKHWFVDFEFPDENGQPYKSAGGAMVDSELGPIPAGWRVGNLGEIADIKTGPFGSQLLNKDYIDGGTPIITVEHIKDFRITYQSYPSVSEKDRARLSKYILEEGDIIFSRVGSVDLSALVTKQESGWLFSSRMLRARPNKDVTSIFISCYFKRPSTRKYIQNIAVGSTMPSINTEILSSINIIIPKKELCNKFTTTISSFIDKSSSNTNQIQTLTKLRDTLLPKLMSGQIRIPED